MLYTNLIHLETFTDLDKMTRENENVLIVCGRMDPQSVTIYRIAESMAQENHHVKFCDMEYDNPESIHIRQMPEFIQNSISPLTLYLQKSQVVKAFSGIQSEEAIAGAINEIFLKKEKI